MENFYSFLHLSSRIFRRSEDFYANFRETHELLASILCNWCPCTFKIRAWLQTLSTHFSILVSFTVVIRFLGRGRGWNQAILISRLVMIVINTATIILSIFRLEDHQRISWTSSNTSSIKRKAFSIKEQNLTDEFKSRRFSICPKMGSEWRKKIGNNVLFCLSSLLNYIFMTQFMKKYE